MKFSKLDAVVSGLYNEIVSNEYGPSSNRELIELEVNRDSFDSEFKTQIEYIKDRLTKLFKLFNNKINLTFEPNMANYNSFVTSKRLQVVVSYTIK